MVELELFKTYMIGVVNYIHTKLYEQSIRLSIKNYRITTDNVSLNECWN